MKVFLLIAIAVLMLGSMTATAVYAHAPTAVSLSNITETQIQINWTHAVTDGCGSGCEGLTDVNIMRIPGQIGSTLNTVLVTNSTAYVVYNNATGLSSWVDHSLPEGTYFNYQVCHPEAGKVTCSTADTDGTNAGNSGKVYGSTKAAAPSDVTLSTHKTSIDVFWPGFVNGTGATVNGTAVAGLKVEYSSDSGSSYTTATSNSSATAISGSKDSPLYTITGLTEMTSYLVKVSGVTQNLGANYPSMSGNVGTALVIDAGSTGKFTPQSNPAPTATVYANGAVTGSDLKVTLKEDRGWDRILNTVLYTNISASQGIENSDTYITWNFFDGVSVTDPHGYFNTVDVVGERSGVRTQDFTYDITWNRSLAANDVIIETKDFQSNAGLTVINNAWTEFPAKQISHEIPEETSNEPIMALYEDGGVMNHAFLTNDIDYALVSDMQYFIQDEIIDVSQDEVVLEQEGAIELFENITLSQESIKIGSEYLNTLIVSGTVNTKIFSIGNVVTFTIIGPDGSESKINAVTTSDRIFEVPIILEGLKSGIYQLQPVHDVHTGEALSFRY